MMTIEQKLAHANGTMWNGIKNYKSNVKGMGSFYLIFNNAANIQYQGFYGISHLVEHCMCQKIKDFQLQFEKNGISYNASTGMTEVSFFIKGLDEGVQKFREQFYDSIINYQITQDVFERERQIVIQEYKDALGDPQYTFFENICRKYFCTRLPLGQFKSLENITYENFIKFKNCYFAFPTYICNTSKSKIKRDQFITINITYNLIDVTANAFKKGFALHKIKGTISDNSSIIAYFNKFKYSQKTFEEFIYYMIFERYMNYGLSSPLYQELRQKTGHVYYISSTVDSLYQAGNGTYSIFVNTSPQYVDQIKQKLLKCLEENVKSLDKDIFENMIIGLQNKMKKKEFLSYSKTNSFGQKIEQAFKNTEFSFDKFKMYVNKLINTKSNYIIIDDKHI